MGSKGLKSKPHQKSSRKNRAQSRKSRLQTTKRLLDTEEYNPNEYDLSKAEEFLNWMNDPRTNDFILEQWSYAWNSGYDGLDLMVDIGLSYGIWLDKARKPHEVVRMSTMYICNCINKINRDSKFLTPPLKDKARSMFYEELEERNPDEVKECKATILRREMLEKIK